MLRVEQYKTKTKRQIYILEINECNFFVVSNLCSRHIISEAYPFRKHFFVHTLSFSERSQLTLVYHANTAGLLHLSPIYSQVAIKPDFNGNKIPFNWSDLLFPHFYTKIRQFLKHLRGISACFFAYRPETRNERACT